jgi:hypothetical protein
MDLEELKKRAGIPEAELVEETLDLNKLKRGLVLAKSAIESNQVAAASNYINQLLIMVRKANKENLYSSKDE